MITRDMAYINKMNISGEHYADEINRKFWEQDAHYVDLKERKVAGFEDEKIKLMDDFIQKNKSNFNEDDLKFLSKIRK